MHDAVREKVRGFLQEYEGSIRWMYLDLLTKVTVGLGFLIDSPKEAQAMPFTRQEDDERASAEEIAAEWQRVKAAQAGAKAGFRYFESRTQLRLSQEDIDDISAQKIEQFEGALKRVAAFSAFEDWPADAQLGLLSMAWVLGTGFAAKFLKFAAACARRDFDGAAAECRISNGPARRNDAHAMLFRTAAQVLARGADVTQIYYPGEVPGEESTAAEPTTDTEATAAVDPAE